MLRLTHHAKFYSTTSLTLLCYHQLPNYISQNVVSTFHSGNNNYNTRTHTWRKSLIVAVAEEEEGRDDQTLKYIQGRNWLQVVIMFSGLWSKLLAKMGKTRSYKKFEFALMFLTWLNPNFPFDPS